MKLIKSNNKIIATKDENGKQQLLGIDYIEPSDKI